MTIEILRYPLITALVAVLLWIGAGRFLETETQAASLFAGKSVV